MSGSSPGTKPKRFPLSLDQVASRPRATPTREVLRPQAPLHQAEQHRRQRVLRRLLTQQSGKLHDNAELLALMRRYGRLPPAPVQ